MLDFKIIALADEGDNIEPGVEVYVVDADIGVGGTDDMVHLAECDSLLGAEVFNVLPGFHFDHDEQVVPASDDVEFHFPAAPVYIANYIPFGNQVFRGSLFSCFAQLVVPCHKLDISEANIRRFGEK